MAGKIRTLSFAEGVSVASPTETGGVKTLSDESYTITDTDGYNLIVCGGTVSAARQVTLPSAASNTGRIIRFIRTADFVTSYYYNINATVSGSTVGNYLWFPNARASVISDGSAWYWLDDVQEEGTWTPTFSASTTAFTTVTYDASYVYGSYTRTGRTCQFSFGLGWTNTTGTASGRIRVDGLPFNAVNTTAHYTTISTITDNIVFPATTIQFEGRVWKGDNYIEFYGVQDGANATSSVANSNGGAASRYIYCSGVYRIQ